MLRRFRFAAVLPLLLAACGGNANPYQGVDVETLFRTATQEYEQEEYQNTIRALDRLLISFGDWDRIPEARILLAHAYYGKGDYLTARSEYMRFLDRYAGHAEAPVAALGVCRSLAALSPEPERDQAYTQDAITVCRNVVIDFAGTPESREAAELSNQMRLKLAQKEFMTAEFYFRRKLYDSAIIYYQSVADLYSETDFAPRGLLGVILSNEAIGYDDEAKEARERLLREFPDSEAAARIRTNGVGS